MPIDLTSPAQLQKLLAKYGLRPKKRFGQNFLVDRNVLDKIAAALDLDSGDKALEIGPGVGTLTAALAETGALVTAVEIDRDMIPILGETLSDHPNVKIINADFLSLDPSEVLTERTKVAGNLPYYITSPIIAKLIKSKEKIERIVLMVQKEVAERLAASPGGRDYGSMSVFVQYHCEVETIARVSRNVFLPPPDVESAIVRLTPRKNPPVEVQDEEKFFKVVRAAFGKRRKTLLNSLSGLSLTREQIKSALEAAGIDPARRAETLSLIEFARIAETI